MSLKHLVTATAKRTWKEIGTPNPPNRGAKATRREVVPTIQGRTCEAEQGEIKATRRLTQEEIGELRQVTQGNGVGWARVQAMSQGGHEVKVLTSTSVLPQGRGHGTKTLTSTSMLPPLLTNEAPRGPPIGVNAQCPAGMSREPLGSLRRR